LNIKKISCSFVVFAIAPLLCAFQADTPGVHLGFVGGGGQNLNYTKYEGFSASLDYWYFNIPFRYVFEDGNKSLGLVFTYMHMNHSTRTEFINPANSTISEVRFIPYWSHNPNRYFGYSAGPFVTFSNANQSYNNDVNPVFPVLVSFELRIGVLDIAYLSIGALNPDLAGDVSGLANLQIVLAQNLIPRTHFSVGASGFGDVVKLMSGSGMKWVGIVPMFAIKVQPIKLMSIVASLKMNGTDLWNVSSGVEFIF